MNPQQIDDILSGRSGDLSARTLRLATSVAEPFYYLGQQIHQGMYRWGLKKSEALSVPVISIGNLTTGGTGKTPITAMLVKLLQEQGRHPGIASRGYHALDDETNQPKENDEHRVLEILCPNVPHQQNRDRVRAGRDLVELGADVILLDDGLQHLRLQRDLNLVVIDALNPFGYEHLLPRGLLREPIRALKRADLIMITRVDLIPAEQLDQLKERIHQQCHVPIIPVQFAPTSWLAGDQQRLSLEERFPESIICCGIGNPAGFLRTLSRIGIESREDKFRIYPDHHHYSSQDAEELARLAREGESKTILTTLKDYVKLNPLLPPDVRCLALMIEAQIPTGADELKQILNEMLKR
ncbi:MAG: tetraacyldisaccharide 4'-kinase [Planctomycetaceae bacterium]|nr:tetraacyldisaccharide 4'-kinase [Planctomycetaceae bacterium]